MLTICALTTAGLAWSWFGRIDIIATARGKVEPAGHVKVVEPLQTGAVADILVTDGQKMKAGAVLLRLDASETTAGLAEATQALSAAQAEALRRQAEIDTVRGGRLDAPASIVWPAAIPPATRAREASVLQSDLGELSATLANLAAQEREKTAAVEQLDLSLAADLALVQPLAERVELRHTLFGEGNGSKLNLLDAVQSALENKVQIAGDSGRRIMANAAIASLQTERRRVIEAFLADDERKLADIRRTEDEKAQEQAKAQARLDEMTLTAPIDGTVQALAVTNRGQVVTTGQEVMRLVPSIGKLEIEAYVTNDDSGFVVPGQVAAVKVDSFPFARFGMLEAQVAEIAYDAIPADGANLELGDATRKADPSSRDLTPTTKPMTNLVFEARLQQKALAMNVNGYEVPLTAGMTVTADIKTGSRRIAANNRVSLLPARRGRKWSNEGEMRTALVFSALRTCSLVRPARLGVARSCRLAGQDDRAEWGAFFASISDSGLSIISTLPIHFLCCVLSLISLALPSLAAGIQPCTPSKHGSLRDALADESLTDDAALKLKKPVERSMNVFPGWKMLPSDVRIVSGPVRITIGFPTTVRALPSLDADEGGGLLPPYQMEADCGVRDRNGATWFVGYDYTGTLFYVDSQSTGKKREPSKPKRIVP